MKNIDLKYICTAIGNLSGVPIRLFYDGNLILNYSIVNLPKDPMLLYQKSIFEIKTHVGYFITPHFNYYGIINAEKYKIVVGPTRQLVHNLQDLRSLAFRMDIPQNDLDTFIAGMQSIVRMPLESVMQMLCVVNYILNDEKLELKDIAIYDAQQQNIRKELAAQSMERQPASEANGVYSQQEVHNTLAVEQTIENIIRKGDTAVLKEWIATAPAVRAGIMANEELRQSKNTFVVAATIASRAAIRGGMDTEDALSLSDAFIQKCELLNNIEQITNLQYRMILEFTEQVEKLQRAAQESMLAIQVTNYIHHHISEAITVEAIARHLYLSRPYLSAKFKEETGQSLTDFILKEKTEEAKRLLCYSGKSLLNISNYLGFSSQSHFSRVFKKYSGLSPSEYRDRYTR
ncbi:MAG: helix-turn-helix domain-containing protein [Lachnospiraceae bacterium]|nr:helix-turn-helix domain-containing protein [Lachnospiraceae bacterium]